MIPTARRGIGVVLLSYNRPQMLQHAYDSILRSGLEDGDKVVLVDDGSDVFDAFKWAHERNLLLSMGQQRSLDERMSKPSTGRIINAALEMLDARMFAAVAYLCDDDLFGRDWLHAVRDTLRTESDDPPAHHVIRGQWRIFKDPLTDGPLPWPKGSQRAPLDPRKMTTGNFAHRLECYSEEGLRWSEQTVAVHDDTFLWRMHAVHDYRLIPTTNRLAGYRRDHAWNMANFTSGQDYGIGADDALARGPLE